MEKNKSILFKNRFFYGVGAIGPTIFDSFVGSFLTLYATDVLGFDALSFASLLMVPKIIDILIDIFIMYFIGKTKTKFGMYRPWLLNIVAMTIAFIIMFSTKCFNFNESSTLIIMFISYLICNSICDSFYWISYIAIPGVITENQDELVRLSSSKSIFEYAIATIVSAITMPILLAFGDYKDPSGWLAIALIFGFISLLSGMLCFFFVKTDLNLEKKMTSDYIIKDVLSDYKNILMNKKFIANSVLLVLIYLVMYIYSGVSYYFYIYNLHIEELVGYLAFIGTGATIFTSLFIGKFQKGLGIKKCFFIGISSLIISSISIAFTYNFSMMVVSGVFYMIGTVSLSTLIFSLWPDVARGLDSKKVKAPLNNTIGLSNVFSNFAIIIGNMIGAAIVTYSKYNPNLDAQNDFTLNMFRYSYPVITIVLSIVMIVVVLLRYKEKPNNI